MASKGLYEIVVNGMIAQREKVYEAFEEQFYINYQEPFFSKKLNKKSNQFFWYYEVYYTSIKIYPKQQSYLLFPCFQKLKSGDTTLNYLLFDLKQHKVYEWTYFKPTKFSLNQQLDNQENEDEVDSGNTYYQMILKNLNTITEWSAEYLTLDDDKFWLEYVWKKKGGKYQYLRLIED